MKDHWITYNCKCGHTGTTCVSFDFEKTQEYQKFLATKLTQDCFDCQLHQGEIRVEGFTYVKI